MSKKADPGVEASVWGDIGRWMRHSHPANTGSSRSSVRRLPRIANPVLIGAIGVGAIGAGIAMRAMRPQRRQGRSERMRELILEAFKAEGLAGVDACDVEVGEGFGKPSLVSFDVCVAASASAEEAAQILEVATRAAWDNPELAPIVIRGRVLCSKASVSAATSAVEGEVLNTADRLLRAEGEAEEAMKGKDPESSSRRVFADMTALGFADEIARPDELYARFGAPASDPTWRP